MAQKIRLEFANGRVTYTKSLLVKAVDAILADERYSTELSRKALIEWFVTHVHVSLKGRFTNGSVFSIKTDTANTVDVSFRKNIGFLSSTDANTTITEAELVDAFKRALATSTIVKLNPSTDE